MPFVMNMLIMFHVCHLSMEMVGESLKIVPKSTPLDINLAYPIKILQDVKDLMKIQADFMQLSPKCIHAILLNWKKRK